MKLAAIDIGSNAARLLITEVSVVEKKEPVFNKLNLIRVPLRLGFDVFEYGIISKEKIGMILQTMKAYKHFLNAYGVNSTNIIACATSAMRDARNASDIIRKIKLETDISIEVISGEMEAGLIFENHIAENLASDHSYMYIDVGGGSTEISFFSNSKLSFKESFNIGTIRLLKNMVKEKSWDEMKETIRAVTKGQKEKEVIAIGSGGNINKIFSMSSKKDGKPLSLELLRELYKDLGSLSLEDRINSYFLRPDRADVIVPALLIYINAMRWSGADEIYVPKIGLADGLIRHLWDQVKGTNL